MGWHSALSLPRRAEVSTPQAVLAYLGRFYDELAGGVPDVLMPTLQAQFGLSLAQVGLLRQVLDAVAVGIEPANGVLLDLWSRTWLMAFGAGVVGLSLVTLGTAPSFAALLIAYMLFGLASGPLAHTGDVVVIESYPTVPDRAFARSTLIDTVGALLAPLLVTLIVWQGWSWRALLVAVGGLGCLYGLVILLVRLPRAPGLAHADGRGFWGTVRSNLAAVLQDQEARHWLLLLFVFQILETPAVLKTVWLARVAGMGQGLIGVYVMLEMAVGLVSLVVLDQWRRRVSSRQVLIWVTAAVGILYPAWLFVPGIWSRFLLMVPLAFAFTMFWPVLKARSLASVAGKAGALTAIHALFGLLPLPLLLGLLADRVGLTPAMLGMHVAASGLLGWLLFRFDGN